MIFVVSTSSPSELAKKQKMELMRREHTAALKYEGMSQFNALISQFLIFIEKILMSRLVLIKTKALEFINQLKVMIYILL